MKPTTKELEEKFEWEKEEAAVAKEVTEEAKPKKAKPHRGLATEELGAKLVHDRNVDRGEVPETNEVIEEEEAINGKEEIIEDPGDVITTIFAE